MTACTDTREHVGYRLTAEIVSRSEADTWDEAKREWALAEVYFTEQPGTCICGHFPMVEHCVIVNQLNGNTVVVGNVCVTKFLGLPSDKLFSALKRVAADNKRALNAAMIEHAHAKGWINSWEREFYLDTMRKRKMSDKQRAKREQINRQVLYWATRAT